MWHPPASLSPLCVRQSEGHHAGTSLPVTENVCFIGGGGLYAQDCTSSGHFPAGDRGQVTAACYVTGKQTHLVRGAPATGYMGSFVSF